VTHIRGRHTLKAGGSLTTRSREVLNADNIVGQFFFSQNQTSNCAGIASGCSVNANTGFDVASFLLGTARRKNRSLFSDKPYLEKRPEWAAYIQDDFRATSRLTLNMGLRWDMFVPWIEDNNLQSNFDPSTGMFVVASDDAVINGVHVGRYLQTYAKTDFGPRFGFAYDLTGDGRTTIRGGLGVFWNWGVGGTSSSKATNPPFLQTTDIQANGGGSNLTLSTGLPPPPAVDPTLRPNGTTRSVFDINYRDQYATNYNVNLQKQLGRDYMIEVAYVGSKGRHLTLKTDQNQAPPIVGVTDQNVNRPFAKISPALRTVGTAESSGTLDYNAFLFKGVKRFSNGFSALVSYTFGKAIDLVSDNDGTVSLTNIFDPSYDRGPANYDVTHTLVASFLYELPFARKHVLGGWQVNGIGYWRTGIPVNITQSGTMASTGLTNNRPNRIGDGMNSDPTIDHWFDPTAFQRTPDSTGTFGDAGRNIMRGPGVFNVDLSLVKNTKFGRVNSELRVEAFNVFNHPQFGQPNGQLGNAAFGTITAAGNPQCGTCGTSERQIQAAVKLRF